MTVLFGLLMFIVICGPEAEAAQSSLSRRTTLTTMSDATEMVSEVKLQLLLDTEIGSGDVVPDDAFVRLLNYIDLHVIGQGRVSTIDVDRLFEFVRQHKTDPGLADVLVAEYQRSGFSGLEAETHAGEEGALKLGGYLVGEIERHQEPDGRLATLYEINQLRLYFARELNPSSAATRVSVLAEWNPVPEEVVHQPDVVRITRDGVTDTLALPPAAVEGLIQFEQLHARVSNVAGSGVELTIGQFRNPFGLWSDYTSHRNFTTTKNNVVVNGFALKKIELGVMARRKIGAGLEIQAALVHGRQGRTSELSRADADDAKDVVGRITYEAGQGRVFGTSFYLGEMSAHRNVAYGVDFSVPLGKLLLSGELVHQRNNDMQDTFGSAFAFNEARSTGSYVQFDYSLHDRLSVYGMYEAWVISAGGQRATAPTYKAFQGLRYSVSPGVRWVLLEYGRMFWDVDQGKLHVSSQLELTF